MTGTEQSKLHAPDPRVWPLSVQAYRSLGQLGLIPKNTELLYGQVFYKMSKSPFHSYLLQSVLEVLQQVIPAEFLIRTEQPLTCSDSEPEPDIAVVRGRKEDFREDHPRTAELVIEVCVTSYEQDQFKLAAYAQAGVKEVWLILASNSQVEVLRSPDGAAFGNRILHGPGGRIASSAFPTFTLDLDKLFQK